ncbi:hypothetical protein CASFOL_028855 [Castilleja foliolosa]|uniref:Uncharacterized protein n=1 Tax=Castilleja foliolosa TaxID=1961234 RepID=A0ABD3CD93_9LAMI
MAIFRTTFVSILVFIIFTPITSSPTSHSLINDTNIKHLFSKVSWFGGFNKSNSDLKKVLIAFVDSPLQKAKTFSPQLDNIIKETRKDTIWKGKYESCNKNYKDVIHKLEDVKKKLKKSGDCNVCVRLKNAHEDIKSCRNMLEFDRKNRKKPANGIHILKTTTNLDSSLSDAENHVCEMSKEEEVKCQVHVMGIK